MPEIIIPDGAKPENQEEDDVLKITYEPSETDEECFFLIYHMNMAPSEAYKLDGEYRKWLIGRMIVQKEHERAAFEQHQIAQRIMPNLRSD